MLFNDIFLLEIFIFILVLFYIINTNLIVLLYTGFLYLILLGCFLLINDADIYIGFLWVIDLGVGLVFFIFILHFSSFLFQKSYFYLSMRYILFFILLSLFLIIFFYFNSVSVDYTFNYTLNKIWFFKISFLDYYLIYYSYEITDLNTLRDTYFFFNSFEFFLVNFSLLFGLITSILAYFLIHRIFSFLNYSQFVNYYFLYWNYISFIFRNQNFFSQQLIVTNVNQWLKIKNKLWN